MTDPWSILGVARDVSEADLKTAYRKLAMQYHPDRNPGDKAAEDRFKEVSNAYEAIRSGAAEQDVRSSPFSDSGFAFHFGPGGFSVHDFMAAAGVGGFHGFSPPRNQDLHTTCALTLKQAFTGHDLTVEVKAPTARSISVRIPAGVVTGTRLRVPQAGDRSHPSLTPGDLYVQVLVTEHPRFERIGPDLLVKAEASVFDVLLGGAVETASIDEQPVKVTIPAGHDPRTRLRVAGRGMPRLNAAGRGDLLIELLMTYPLLSEAQRDLLHKARSLA